MLKFCEDLSGTSRGTEAAGEMSTDPSENVLLKLIYCACQKVLEKWNQPMHNCSLIISQLQIYFDGRINLGAVLLERRHH